MPPLQEAIELRGGRQHNLKNIGVHFPLGKITVVCGVSGSGKTSLALDTIHAEGQRRFVECFSASARQYLQRWNKPEFDYLSPLPPSIAVIKKSLPQSQRALVGTVTECADYLRILFANCATLHCYRCQSLVEPSSPASISRWLEEQDASMEAILVAAISWESKAGLSEQLGVLQAEGYVRLILAERMWHLGRDDRQKLAESVGDSGQGWIAIDRFRGGKQASRTVESLESAFAMKERSIALLIYGTEEAVAPSNIMVVDGKRFVVRWCPRGRVCLQCELEYPEPVPALFHFNSPLGACPACQGSGVIPSAKGSLSKGKRSAKSPVQATNHEPSDGMPAPADTTGLQCPQCQGKRFQPMALAYTVHNNSIADLLSLSVEAFEECMTQWGVLNQTNAALQDAIHQIQNRIRFLDEVGLGYLGLDRPVHTLSTGEAQRVALTSILSSDLTNMLYVLDEPTTGLHPLELPDIAKAIRALCERGNTVVVVEHEPEIMKGADWIIEMGPQGGGSGGEVLFAGTVDAWLLAETPTSRLLGSNEKAPMGPTTSPVVSKTHHHPQRDGIQLVGARGNNLQAIDVFFPLHSLCVVTGVSGSGKSSLIQDTLYPALASELQMPHETPLPYQAITGFDGLDDLVILGRDDIQKLTKSHPVSLIKAFEPIRQLYAEQPEAKIRNWTQQRFSFHHASGRCAECEGTGVAIIDMQFLSDVQLTCPVCLGTRYQEEVLSIQYRQRSIAEVLAMPASEAVAFFRGHPNIQGKLSVLVEYDLGHIPIGQATETLSHGEMQRLRLASKVQASHRSHTLFLLDEPTAGLHPTDVKRLIERLIHLREMGHSFIVIENDPLILRHADYLIELGPGAGKQGGRVVCCGTPQEMMSHPDSITGPLLSRHLR